MASDTPRKTVKNGIAFTGRGWSYVLRIPDPSTGKTKPKWVGGFDSEKRKEDGQFCSPRCGQTVRQRRYRERQKIQKKLYKKVSASKAENKVKTSQKGKSNEAK